MGVRFITNHPALFISDEKALVIADLHLGLEHELFKSGITIAPQAEKFKRIISKLLRQTKATKLIVLGDLKHKVPGVSFRELRELPKLLNYLVERVEVVLVKGNHDVELKGLIPESMKVYGSRGFKLSEYGFFHGHAWPKKKLMGCDHLFMAHIHPAVEFKDKLGFRSIKQVWVKGKLNEEFVKRRYKIERIGDLETVIVPAFNRILGGIALNAIVEEKYIGPLLEGKLLDVGKSKAYMLDGSFLGNINELRSLVKK